MISPVHPASTGGDPAQRTQSLAWSKAGDEYVRFNEADVKDGGSGMAAWLRLKIHARYPESSSLLQSKQRECSVCLGTGSENDAKDAWASTPCSHHFHAKCLDGWKAFQQIKGRCADCPMCRGALA